MSIKSMVYLGVGLLVGLTLAGHGVSRSPSALAQQAASPCKAAAVTPASKFINRTIKTTLGTDPWQITVTKVAVAATVNDVSGAAKPAKGKYVFLYVTARNLGKKSQTLGMDAVSLTLLDSQGRSFDMNVTASDGAASQANVSLLFESAQPTFTLHTVLAFDVAKDTHGVKLQYADFGGTPQTLLSLGL